MFSKAPFLFVAMPGTAAVGAVAALLALGPVNAGDDAFIARVPGAATITTEVPTPRTRVAALARADIAGLGGQRHSSE
jgi:hypothetical protein